MVHLRRYYVGEDWTPQKLEVLVDMPEHFSLESLRGRGPQVTFFSCILIVHESLDNLLSNLNCCMQSGEDLQPENGVGEEADELLVAQLISMGFPESKCRRAAVSTGNTGKEANAFVKSVEYLRQ